MQGDLSDLICLWLAIFAVSLLAMLIPLAHVHHFRCHEAFLKGLAIAQSLFKGPCNSTSKQVEGAASVGRSQGWVAWAL